MCMYSWFNSIIGAVLYMYKWVLLWLSPLTPRNIRVYESKKTRQQWLARNWTFHKRQHSIARDVYTTIRTVKNSPSFRNQEGLTALIISSRKSSRALWPSVATKVENFSSVLIDADKISKTRRPCTVLLPFTWGHVEEVLSVHGCLN